jgi:hypothetical protein
MTQRVSFSVKEKRRDQRRQVSIRGSIDGCPVEIVDLSLSGVGGGAVELRETQPLDLQEGQYTILELRGENEQHIELNIEIRRVFADTAEFGAVFHDISSSDFDTIEKLMFRRRGNAKE